ncbi:MAG TPA: hypothetical protein VHF88_05505 [Thermoleophilaceae bacterium]|nr:hypothetical protein [Thermoleophilaceae bacterium]
MTDHESRRRLAGAVAATLAVALGAFAGSACGAGDEATDPKGPVDGTGPAAKQIRATYAAFTDAVYEGDFEAACATMTRTLRRSLDEGRRCSNGLRAVYGDGAFDRTRPRIARLRIDGDSAEAEVQPGAGGASTKLTFVRREGEWRMAR